MTIQAGDDAHGFTLTAPIERSTPINLHAADTNAPDPNATAEDEPNSKPPRSALRSLVEWAAIAVAALVFALFIKTYVIQAFEIPSPSMTPTVKPGDRIVVNKLSYRLHDVHRGDLVVFARLDGVPAETDNLIKRAIGLPGDTIEVREDGRIWIWKSGETANDALLLTEPYLDEETAIMAPPSDRDPVSGGIWDPRCQNTREPGVCTLGPTDYFMLGDNRNGSLDSRFFGPVPAENIVGRAFWRIWPLNELSLL